MRERKRREGARAYRERQGARARARPSWARPGWVASRVKNLTTHTTTDWNPKCETKSTTRRDECTIKHDIKQKRYASA
jgi:hypothetical protein